jgi:hypothetical protein
MVRHIYFATKVQIKSQNAKNIDDYLLNLPVAIKKQTPPQIETNLLRGRVSK